MKTIVVLILILITLGICYAEEPTAERPIYSARDYWFFIKDGKEAKDIRLEFLREEKYEYVFSRNGEEFITDFNLTSLEKKNDRNEYPGPIIKFPLKIGKWWDHEFDQQGGTATRITKRYLKKVARYKVEAYEEMPVAAGTFWAFKVSVSIEIIYKQNQKYVGSATYWYAPSVKQIIKSVEKEKTSELREYKIN